LHPFKNLLLSCASPFLFFLLIPSNLLHIMAFKTASLLEVALISAHGLNASIAKFPKLEPD
jgi:hypothetical protein